jgi:choline dehydrogenase-like flavoprotein
MDGPTNATNGVNGHNTSAICNSAEEFLAHEYDFIIVGGGTAGLVVAARLTENPDVTVGVIEAGKNRLGDMFVDIPALFLQMFGNEDYDWKFHTTPQACSSSLQREQRPGC